VFLNIDLNVSTNLIDPSQPVDLTPHEVSKRTWGSKTVLLVEQCMCAVQWGTKCCLLLLYWRLTQNLRQALVVKIAAAYVLVTYIVMEIFYFAVWCRPFHDYWQTPTTNTQCTTALHHLIMNLVFNLTSDILILSIPLPLMLKSHIELKKKVLLVFPFSLGLFTMLCAILSKNLSFNHPYSSEWVYWYCRESSTAMIVANMPYSWALIRKVFKLRSFLGDSATGHQQAGQPRSLDGRSLGAMQLDSQPHSRQASRTEKGQSNHKLSWNKLKIKSRKDSTPHTWSEHTDTKTNHTPWSSTTSSDDSVQRPAPAVTTDWAVDRLYPLDDEDLTMSNSWTDEKQPKIDNPNASNKQIETPARQSPAAATTDWTIDRLYPLDDDEDGTAATSNATQRRYEGV
jgi:hypothetical protein